MMTAKYDSRSEALLALCKFVAQHPYVVTIEGFDLQLIERVSTGKIRISFVSDTDTGAAFTFNKTTDEDTFHLISIDTGQVIIEFWYDIVEKEAEE